MHDAPQQQESFFREIVKFSLVALLIVVPIRFFVAQPFIVSGASMEPTFDTGEYLIVDQVSFRFEDPARGEVIIFKYPKDPSKYFIKRIIGLPGETVRVESTRVSIVNREHPDGFLLEEPYLDEANLIESGDMTVSLGAHEYFVLGDNRRASSDSRIWGPLDEEYIVGRALLRLFPIGESGLLPGDHRTL